MKNLDNITLESKQDNILEVQNLDISFVSHRAPVHAVRDISFNLKKAETLAIVGESGCGKSVTVKSIMGLLPERTARIDKNKGKILFDGKNLLELSESEMEEIRGNEIAMIFQDPMTSLNPTMRVGKQIAEPLIIHHGMSESQALKRALELLELVQIPEAAVRINQYPFEFSGGMRQRVVIAMALANNPKILIADEPTTALDVTIQAQILELISEIQAEMGMSVILVTHDLGIVAANADRIQVMYAGQILERGSVDDIYYSTKNPYTYALLSSVPTVKSIRKSKLYSLEGKPPDLTQEGTACPFAPRCEFTMPICVSRRAPQFTFGEKESDSTFKTGESEGTTPQGHVTRCWLYSPRADRESLPENFLRKEVVACQP